MSISNKRSGSKNPAVKYIKWKGSIKDGFFAYYDKTIPSGKKDEKGKDIMGSEVRIKLENLIILDDDLMSITGYRDRDKTTIQSNEVSSFDTSAVLVVNGWKDGKKTELMKGTYQELKPKMQDIPYYKGTKCIYGLLNGELVHIQLTGNGYYQWGQASGGDKSSHYLSHTGTEEGKNGDIEFKFPTFSFTGKFEDEDYDEAIRVDSEILQPYLKEYFKLGGNAPKESDDVNQDPSNPDFDPKKWRTFQLKGKNLASYGKDKILEIQADLVEAGDFDSDIFQAVEQAVQDYKRAETSWRDSKDKSGRSMEDYDLSELYEAKKQIPDTHPSKIKVEAAIEFREKEEKEKEKPQGQTGFTDPEDDFDNDDIPF